MLSNADDSESVHGVFDVVLLVIASVDALLQGYTIFLILLVARTTLTAYRYFLLLSTVLELCFAVVLGFFMRPRILPPTSCASYHGIFAFAGHEAARIALCVAFFFGCAVVCSHYCSIVYRMTIVTSNIDAETAFLRPCVLGPAIAAIFILSAGVSYAMDWAQLSAEIVTGMLPALEAVGIVRAQDTSVQCIDVSAPRTHYIFASIGVACLITEALSLGAGIWTVRRLKRQTSMATSTRKMHIQLTRLVIAQVLMPVVCVLVPVCFIFGATLLLGIPRSSPTSVALKYTAVLCIAAFPLLNAVLTLTFVAPYRRLTASWLRKIMRGELRKIMDTIPEETKKSAVRYSFSHTIAVHH